MPNPPATAGLPGAVAEQLSDYLAGRVAEAAAVGPAAEEAARLVSDFVLGGGKRLRPLFAWVAYAGLAPAAPGKDSLRISVKREDGNGAAAPRGEVSTWLHNHVNVGDVLNVIHPFGDFLPDTESNEPFVLLSAGVGITPMRALFETMPVADGQDLLLLSRGAVRLLTGGAIVRR